MTTFGLNLQFGKFGQSNEENDDAIRILFIF